MQLLRLFAVALLVAACASQESVDPLPSPVQLAQWSSRVDTLPGTYTRVMSPAEFHDSLLIVPDVAERLIWRINLKDGTRSAFGSRGGGPGEWERAGWAVKGLSRDSLVIYQGFGLAPFPVLDVATGRGRTHSAAASHSSADPDAIVLSIYEPRYWRSDTSGSLYGTPSRGTPVRDSATGRLMPGDMLDTLPVVRYGMRTDKVDTLLRLFGGNHGGSISPDLAKLNLRAMGMGAYGAANDWHVMRGGEVLVVDAAAYLVRVHNADGSELRSFTLPWTQIAVTDSGWEAHVQNSTKGSIALLEKSLSDLAAQMGRAMTRPAMPQYVVPDKPDWLPPVSFQIGNQQRRMHSADRSAWIPVNRAEPPVTEFLGPGRCGSRRAHHHVAVSDQSPLAACIVAWRVRRRQGRRRSRAHPVVQALGPLVALPVRI